MNLKALAFPPLARFGIRNLLIERKVMNSEQTKMEDIFETLKLSMDGTIGILAIDREKKLNALSTQVFKDFTKFFELFAADAWPGMRGLLLLGHGGRAFAAGADIREMNEMTVDQGEAFAKSAQKMTENFEGLPLPVIAAVDGVAFGGGCELALSCDLIYATAQSQFGQPEVKLGLIPGFGGCVRLASYVGLQRAREMIFTGAPIAAQEALECGLVTKVFATRDEMIAGAKQTLQRMARHSPNAIRLCKSAINAQKGLSIHEGLQRELAAFKLAFAHGEKQEGVRAFLQRRTPAF